MKSYYVYIVTNPNRRVLYTGVTHHLERRIVEHYVSRGKRGSFAGKYYCYNLLFFEEYSSISDAIRNEKLIKRKKRAWKEDLIRSFNPGMKFLNHQVLGAWPPDEELIRFLGFDHTVPRWERSVKKTKHPERAK